MIEKMNNSSLNSLFQLAENIHKLKEENSEYSLESFYTLYLPSPYIVGSLNLPIKYFRTVIHRDRSVNETVIKCKKLEKIFDLDSRQVYQAESGALFVYHYKIDQYSENAYFAIPRLEFAQSKTISEMFARASESLINNHLEGLDELLKLSLTNKITQLQEIAYAQGRGTNLLRT